MSQKAFQVSQELLEDVSHTAKYESEEKKKNRALTFSAATIKDKGIDQFVHYELWPQLQSSLPTVRYLGPLNWCHNSAFCFFFFKCYSSTDGMPNKQNPQKWCSPFPKKV